MNFHRLTFTLKKKPILECKNILKGEKILTLSYWDYGNSMHISKVQQEPDLT